MNYNEKVKNNLRKLLKDRGYIKLVEKTKKIIIGYRKKSKLITYVGYTRNLKKRL